MSCFRVAWYGGGTGTGINASAVDIMRDCDGCTGYITCMCE